MASLLYGILAPVRRPFSPFSLSFSFLSRGILRSLNRARTCSPLSLYHVESLYFSFVGVPHRYVVQVDATQLRQKLETKLKPGRDSAKSSLQRPPRDFKRSNHKHGCLQYCTKASMPTSYEALCAYSDCADFAEPCSSIRNISRSGHSLMIVSFALHIPCY